ncbi:MAG: hypothetical protein VKP62_11490 [Candidatus Sericytochromatia bacterium]|nr:hypothetical protein [Candidatus Sericytochromatia bacterium]
MPIVSRTRILLATTLLVMGCQAAPPSTRPIRALAPELNQGAQRATSLRMLLRQKDVQAAFAKKYGLQQMQQIDWDMVRVWLSNSRDGFVTRMEKASPTLDSTTNTRTAALLFDNLTPGDGYGLVLYLYRNGDQSRFDTAEASAVLDIGPEVIASGSNPSFALRTGLNNINVNVTLTAPGGDFDVNVEDPATPAIPTIAGQFRITTLSHFNNDPTFGDIDGTVGSVEIGGIAPLMDDSGDVVFTTSGGHQIWLWDASAATATLLAGTGTQTSNYDTQAGDYGPSLDGTLHTPRGIVVGQNGEILFCDTGNNRIRALRRDTDTNPPFVIAPSVYRLETLIGSGAISLASEGDSSTDPIRVTLSKPVGLVADDTGTVFFTEDLPGSSKVRVYRYKMDETDMASATVTHIKELTRTNSTATHHYGQLAINRLRNQLWVTTGDNQIVVLRNIYNSTSDAPADIVASFAASTWMPATGSIKALTFDQVEGQAQASFTAGERWGTLYASLTPTSVTTGQDVVYRIPVASNGLMPTNRVAEPIAGGNQTMTTTWDSTNHARKLALTLGWGALAFDLTYDPTKTFVRFFTGTTTGDLHKITQNEVSTHSTWNASGTTEIFYPVPDPSPN